MAQQLGIFVVEDLGRVAAVIEHHVGRPAPQWTLGRAAQGLLDAPLVFLLALAFPGKDRNAAGGHRRCGMVLGREDVARAPANRGAELDERLDQHRGLDRHVKAADDACPRKRFRGAEFIAQRHQPRHFGLGDGDLAPPPVGERNIGNLKIGRCGHPWLSLIISQQGQVQKDIHISLYRQSIGLARGKGPWERSRSIRVLPA